MVRTYYDNYQRRKKGNQSVVVMKDRYNKLSKTIPTPKTFTKTVARISLELYVSSFSIPSTLHMNSDFQILSNLFVAVGSTLRETQRLPPSISFRQRIKRSYLIVRFCRDFAVTYPIFKMMKKFTWCHWRMLTMYERTDLLTCHHSAWHLREQLLDLQRTYWDAPS